MFNFIPGQVYAIALVLSIGWIGVQEIRISSLQGDMSTLKLAIEQAKTKALQEKADVETQWRKRLDASDRQHADEVDSYRVDLSKRSSLQPAIDSYVSKARSACPGPRGTDQPRGDPIGVLTKLLSREGTAADFYARVADERRIIAAKCERDYDALRE